MIINIEITPALEGASQAEKQAIMDEQEPLVAGLKACQQNLSQEMHMIAYLLNGEPNAKGIVIGSDSALIYKRDRLETLSMRIQQSVIKTAVSARPIFGDSSSRKNSLPRASPKMWYAPSGCGLFYSFG